MDNEYKKHDKHLVDKIEKILSSPESRERNRAAETLINKREEFRKKYSDKLK
jgi:hypothetical protein